MDRSGNKMTSANYFFYFCFLTLVVWRSMSFFTPINKNYLKNLDGYTSCCVDYSICRTYITSPIQNVLVKLFPKWLAPNVITLMGLCVMIFSAFISVVFSPRFESMEVPRYVFIINGVSLVVYRFLDDMDGKQARRTGSSSPLGELFDHGCDAFTGALGQISLLVMCATGPTFFSYFLVANICVNYIFETWTEYYTGTMQFGYINSINEGVYVAAFFEILGGIFGHKFYHYTLTDIIRLDYFPLNVFTVWQIAVAGAVLTSLHTAGNSLVKMRKVGILKNLAGIIPPSFLLVLFAVWTLFSPIAFESYPIMFLICFMFMFSYEISSMTLAFVLKMPLRVYSLPIVPLIAVIIVQILPMVPGLYKQLAFFYVLIQSILVYTWFAVLVCWMISSYLNINVFTIKSKSPIDPNDAKEEVLGEDDVEIFGEIQV